MTSKTTNLQIILAKYKVYDAWQYVQSLSQTLTYMNASQAIIERVYDNRQNKIKSYASEMVSKAFTEPGKAVSFTSDNLSRTNINIAGLEVDDAIYLEMTVYDFFHYARLCIELLYQVINAALFGDDAYPINTHSLPKKVITKLGKISCFSSIKEILDIGFMNEEVNYLIAFDNYMKHTKTILISTKNNFLFNTYHELKIANFTYHGTVYQSFDALPKISNIRNEVIKIVEEVLFELEKQVPNCINNGKRFHSVHFRQIIQDTAAYKKVEYISFFIEVKNDLSEIPSQIRVMPLIIKANDEIYSFILDIDTIFITKEGTYESGIIGKATLQPRTDSNALYKPYHISACTIDDYNEYIINFQNIPRNIHIDYAALEGDIIFIYNKTSSSN